MACQASCCPIPRVDHVMRFQLLQGGAAHQVGLRLRARHGGHLQGQQPARAREAVPGCLRGGGAAPLRRWSWWNLWTGVAVLAAAAVADGQCCGRFHLAPAGLYKDKDEHLELCKAPCAKNLQTSPEARAHVACAIRRSSLQARMSTLSCARPFTSWQLTTSR